MSDLPPQLPPAIPPPVPPPGIGDTPPKLSPSFGKALRAIWLFTWRPRLTWKRLAMGALFLLVLPGLVVLTTLPPGKWPPPYSVLGKPSDHVRRILRPGRNRPDFQAEQRARLQQIFEEEYARTENYFRETQSSRMSVERDQVQVKRCYTRIRDRVQPLLNARQLTHYDSYESKFLQETLNRVSQPRWTRTGPFYHWLIDFYFFIILPLSCVLGCGALIRSEIQSNTLGFLTTRPLGRARLLLAKFLAQTSWLQIVLGIETLLFFAAGAIRAIPALGELLLIFLASQFLAVYAWSALGTFLGQVTNRYIALAVVYGFLVELGIGNIPTNINTLSLMRHLKVLLAHNPALYEVYEWSGTGVPLAILALGLATGLFLGLAALLFTYKEYHHNTEMQK